MPRRQFVSRFSSPKANRRITRRFVGGMIGPHAARVLAKAHVIPDRLVEPLRLGGARSGCSITPARKFRMLLHINPTRQRGKRTGSLARASGWYMTFFAAGVIAGLQAAASLRIATRRDRHPYGARVPTHTVRINRLRGRKDCVRPRLLAAVARLSYRVLDQSGGVRLQSRADRLFHLLIQRRLVRLDGQDVLRRHASCSLIVPMG